MFLLHLNLRELVEKVTGIIDSQNERAYKITDKIPCTWLIFMHESIKGDNKSKLDNE